MFFRGRRSCVFCTAAKRKCAKTKEESEKITVERRRAGAKDGDAEKSGAKRKRSDESEASGSKRKRVDEDKRLSRRRRAKNGG